MDRHEVNISIPPSDHASDIVKISGTEANVAAAMEALTARVAELDAEKADRELRQFKLEVRVDPKYHPKIIGRGGAVIKKLRTDHQDVNIQMPAKNAEETDLIVIQGYEASANEARDAILKIVSDLVSANPINPPAI